MTRSGRTIPLALVPALAALLALAGCAPTVPDAEPDGTSRTYPTDERPMSSIALIESAAASGALDYSTALLYKVYVMFDPDSLPPEYASDVPSKCGTPIIDEVRRSWNMLSAEDRAEISQYIQPLGEPRDNETQLDDVTPDRLEDERNRLD